MTQETHARLSDLAQQTGAPITEVVAQAVERYWRQYLIEQSNAAYAALRADPEAWQEEMDERKVWDATLADGLEEEP